MTRFFDRQIGRWGLGAVRWLMIGGLGPAWVCGAEREVDVVVYGGTAAGIAAAVQVKRMGRSVVVIEPSDRIGGLTTGGLGQTDIGNKAAIGGIAREFYQGVRRYYDDPQAWKWQKREEYKDNGQTRTDREEPAMWTFEPSAALTVLQGWVQRDGIEVIYGRRLDRSGATRSGERGRGVEWEGGRIRRILLEGGDSFRALQFIDAGYEGDLAAVAGVSYVVGREANAEFGETLNGVQVRNAKHHQLVPGVSAYRIAGDAGSGLLPGIDPKGPGEEGAGDARVQGYCFRMCLTDHPDNRIPFAKPAGYEPLRYELLLRNFEAGERGMPWINSPMPNRKTDTNNRAGFSTDFIGQNYAYPEASYAERERIVAAHLEYQQGLMWTLANHDRVPAGIRKEFARWGMCKDEFRDGAGWQKQLYIREARRIRGMLVMHQGHCQGRERAADPVGMAAYTMDSHNVQRYVDAEGFARNEGDVQVGGFPPYPIGYGAILPKASECLNLSVPVCLSATHIAFGSIRMEPVFMVLGQSAATAAVLAIESGKPLQEVDRARLSERLLADKQVLEWKGGGGSGERVELKGAHQDDLAAGFEGFQNHSVAAKSFVGVGYRHDGNEGKGAQRAVFKVMCKAAGRYEVRLWYPPNANRATNVPVSVKSSAGEKRMLIDQRRVDAAGAFRVLCTVNVGVGETVEVTVSNAETDGYVVVDAVELNPVK